MTTYPTKGWSSYDESLRLIGERRYTGLDDLAFLRELALVDVELSLTANGENYFLARHVRLDDESADAMLRDALLAYPPAAAICQMLAGVPGSTRDTAATALRSQGFGGGLTDRSLRSLLTLLDRFHLVAYDKRTGAIEVLVQVAQREEPPSSVFVSRATPFANKIWLRRVLESCDGFIYWLDKHFLPIALETLWEAANGDRISEVRILSLNLPKLHGKKAVRQYRDLRTDLGVRRITLKWHTVPSTQIRDTHDRWIIGASIAYNVPDVGTIFSGNNAELHRSPAAPALKDLYESYWDLATPIDA